MRVDLATVFACPFNGWVHSDEVVDLIARIKDVGVKKIALCDTIGVATPNRVYAVSQQILRTFPEMDFSLHLHDTRGVGVANLIAGMQAGIKSFETSIGGLGGCPFAPGAAGNTATEDVVNVLHDMGIATKVDLAKLLPVVTLVAEKVDAELSSRMAKAKIYDCL